MSYHSYFAWKPEQGFEHPGLVAAVVRGLKKNKPYAEGQGKLLPPAFAILSPVDGLIFQLGVVLQNLAAIPEDRDALIKMFIEDGEQDETPDIRFIAACVRRAVAEGLLNEKEARSQGVRHSLRDRSRAVPKVPDKRSHSTDAEAS
jgi:hypothetical protein